MCPRITNAARVVIASGVTMYVRAACAILKFGGGEISLNIIAHSLRKTEKHNSLNRCLLDTFEHNRYILKA